MAQAYKVIKPWGSHKKGTILYESREVRRKLKEGGCLEKMAPESKNKMQEDSVRNKAGK